MKKLLRNILLLGLILALGLTVVGCSKDEGKEEKKVGVEQAEEPEQSTESEEAEENEEDHHHDIAYEWSGIYEFKEGDHTVKFNKNEGDESILVAFISADGNIKDIEHHAAHVMEAEAKDVEKDGDFVAENEYTYKLALNKEAAEFKFKVEKPGKYYVFTEHMPEEFDMEILNADGEALKADKPTVYEGDHDHDHDHDE